MSNRSENKNNENAGASTGCLVCGQPIRYQAKETLMTCVLCKRQFQSNSQCENGHYVCDGCHGAGGSHLKRLLLESSEKDPILLFLQTVELPEVHMHGPEHHSIVPCVMLTAYRNNGGELDLEEALDTAMNRGKQVPGGFCGFWGVCGAAAGAGIYGSIVMGGSPLNAKVWGVPQILAAQCLQEIGKLGGPRCCKRTCRIAIQTAAKFTEENLGIVMPLGGKEAPCTYFVHNRECILERCPYFRGGDA